MTARTIEELNFRRALCKAIIKIVDGMSIETEGRGSALDEYKQQLASIEKQIEEVTGAPPPVVIGLKTAKLSGNADMK